MVLLSNVSQSIVEYMDNAGQYMGILEDLWEENGRLGEMVQELVLQRMEMKRNQNDWVEERENSRQRVKGLTFELTNARANIDDLLKEIHTLKKEMKAMKGQMPSSPSSGFSSNKEDDHHRDSTRDTDLDFTDTSVISSILSGGLMGMTPSRRGLGPMIGKPPLHPSSRSSRSMRRGTRIRQSVPEEDDVIVLDDEQEDQATPVATISRRSRTSRMDVGSKRVTTPTRMRRSLSVPMRSPMERGDVSVPLIGKKENSMASSQENIDHLNSSQDSSSVVSRAQSAVMFVDDAISSAEEDVEYAVNELYPIHGNPVLDRVHQFTQKRLMSRDICDVCCKTIKWVSTAKKCEACHQLVHSECALRLEVPCAPRNITVARSLSSGPKQLHELCHPDVLPRIPHLIILIVQSINSFHLKEFGIYRTQGSVSEVDRVYHDLITNRRFPSLHNYPVPVLTGVLKKFLLKAVKCQLISSCSLKEIVNQLTSDSEEKLIECLERLPLANRDTLCLLCLHWKKVTYYSQDNGMTLHNLCRILAPTVFSNSGPSIPPIGDQISALSAIIELPEAFFYQYMKYSAPASHFKPKTPSAKNVISDQTFRGDVPKCARYTPRSRTPSVRTLRNKTPVSTRL